MVKLRIIDVAKGSIHGTSNCNIFDSRQCVYVLIYIGYVLFFNLLIEKTRQVIYQVLMSLWSDTKLQKKRKTHITKPQTHLLWCRF